ncbi:uncharacterized protein LOC106642718 [Copidosoma floridanum]|uniref:uncharacterized protein LOC106642718 n=1 Tax=Copidosoma floridanum TaxID=29053 RepID=UPI0006C99696|nr:uncharacterized protein LOC106642718 [Copidosoma floridanum]
MTDHNSGLVFLVDTGAEVSLLPKFFGNSSTPSDLQLIAANDTPIEVFGTKELTVDLKFKDHFLWKFHIAAVPHPILGADFLAHFGLLVDMTHRCLIESSSHASSTGVMKKVASLQFSSMFPSYVPGIFSDFPEVVGLAEPKSIDNPEVFHYIETNRPPVAERVRRLNPEKYKAASEEFDRLVREGFVGIQVAPGPVLCTLGKKKTAPGVCAEITDCSTA